MMDGFLNEKFFVCKLFYKLNKSINILKWIFNFKDNLDVLMLNIELCWYMCLSILYVYSLKFSDLICDYYRNEIY